ncbi:NUDIX hydrolase [Priestia taiwanensis]|uniref:ADP-ribose diphosphatase n=1 Tax=Priestia taiwanensis TaxID=1347902 RepID=A0A917AIG9_9BACI|nr:NUDIX hydrolase [Priestia taiwanensis]MBM7361456.1 ADP-ribose pyrophosphatase [Priestia taiwanensis]GGE54269.1 ADP-ribose diphosphatase [Priestia taiwanensis]
MKKFEEKTIATTPIFTGRVISLQVDEVELPDGKKGKREIVKHPGAVAIIAMTDEGKLVLVEQFRKAMERTLMEIPAGKLEPGEEPIVTAGRELEEETGYVCEEMEHVTSFYTSPGFADEYIHIFEAKGLRKKENAASLDEDEFVELLEVTLEEAAVLMKEGKIHDAKTVYALQYLLLKNR